MSIFDLFGLDLSKVVVFFQQIFGITVSELYLQACLNIIVCGFVLL